MPTTAQATFSGARLDPSRQPEIVVTRAVNMKVSTTWVAGTVVGEVTATPGVYAPYASGNVDGSQIPVGFMQYGGSTDASGNISYGTGASEWGQTRKDSPMHVIGIFQCADLVGFDANALGIMGRLIQGTVSVGEVAIFGS